MKTYYMVFGPRYLGDKYPTPRGFYKTEEKAKEKVRQIEKDCTKGEWTITCEIVRVEVEE